jgi:hypothetical protein
MISLHPAIFLLIKLGDIMKSLQLPIAAEPYMSISIGNDLSSSQKINVVDFIILVYESFLQEYVCMT